MRGLFSMVVTLSFAALLFASVAFLGTIIVGLVP